MDHVSCFVLGLVYVAARDVSGWPSLDHPLAPLRVDLTRYWGERAHRLGWVWREDLEQARCATVVAFRR